MQFRLRINTASFGQGTINAICGPPDYVKTQFETIINLTEFQRIKIEWHVEQPSGNVFHIISAESEEISEPIAVESSYPMRGLKHQLQAPQHSPSSQRI